ncbi:MAG: hypothetical protein RDU89_10975, partial [bacterium]|nr:hypothetical protein [bacterium]
PLVQQFKNCRQGKWLILLSVAIAVTGTGVYVLLMPPSYEASSLYLSETTTTELDAAAAYMQSATLLATAAERIGLTESAESLGRRVAATRLEGKKAVQVTVRGRDPTAAAALASSLVEACVSLVVETKLAQLAEASQALEAALARESERFDRVKELEHLRAIADASAALAWKKDLLATCRSRLTLIDIEERKLSAEVHYLENKLLSEPATAIRNVVEDRNSSLHGLTAERTALAALVETLERETERLGAELSTLEVEFEAFMGERGPHSRQVTTLENKYQKLLAEIAEGTHDPSWFPAAVPSQRIGPGLQAYLSLGGIFGLLAGVALVLSRARWQGRA